VIRFVVETYVLNNRTGQEIQQSPGGGTFQINTLTKDYYEFTMNVLNFNVKMNI
jgi:hypothetical protein